MMKDLVAIGFPPGFYQAVDPQGRPTARWYAERPGWVWRHTWYKARLLQEGKLGDGTTCGSRDIGNGSGVWPIQALAAPLPFVDASVEFTAQCGCALPPPEDVLREWSWADVAIRWPVNRVRAWWRTRQNLKVKK
jgi:hypothetical protein